jgi:hypothetical protein
VAAKNTSSEKVEMAWVQAAVKSEHARIITARLILVILAVGGIATFIFQPGHAKDLWLIIGPIIGGSVGYLIGKQSPGRDR